MNHKKGITLVEIVVGMALLALSVSGILGLIFQNTSAGQRIDYSYVAFNLAKNKIERLREIRNDGDYNTLKDNEETDVVLDRYGVGDSNGNFLRTTIIDPNHSSNLTKITVQVKYKRTGKTSPVSAEVVTLISPYF